MIQFDWSKLLCQSIFRFESAAVNRVPFIKTNSLFVHSYRDLIIFVAACSHQLPLLSVRLLESPCVLCFLLGRVANNNYRLSYHLKLNLDTPPKANSGKWPCSIGNTSSFMVDFPLSCYFSDVFRGVTIYSYIFSSIGIQDHSAHLRQKLVSELWWITIFFFESLALPPKKNWEASNPNSLTKSTKFIAWAGKKLGFRVQQAREKSGGFWLRVNFWPSRKTVH